MEMEKKAWNEISHQLENAFAQKNVGLAFLINIRYQFLFHKMKMTFSNITLHCLVLYFWPWGLNQVQTTAHSPPVSHRCPTDSCCVQTSGSGHSCFQSPRQHSHQHVICWAVCSAWPNPISVCVCACANKVSGSNCMLQQTFLPSDPLFMAWVKLNKSTRFFSSPTPSSSLSHQSPPNLPFNLSQLHRLIYDERHVCSS